MGPESYLDVICSVFFISQHISSFLPMLLGPTHVRCLCSLILSAFVHILSWLGFFTSESHSDIPFEIYIFLKEIIVV